MDVTYVKRTWTFQQFRMANDKVVAVKSNLTRPKTCWVPFDFVGQVGFIEFCKYFQQIKCTRHVFRIQVKSDKFNKIQKNLLSKKDTHIFVYYRIQLESME